jgi:hypothetical protein
MMARYHSPSLGRFLSVDPGFDVQSEDPRSWNLYAYVSNNPINATDPDGKVWHVLAGAAGGAVIGGLAELGAQVWKGESISWGRVGAAAVGGAVTGAIVTATLGAATGAAAATGGVLLSQGPTAAGVVTTAAVANAAGGIVERKINGESNILAKAPRDLVVGAALGTATRVGSSAAERAVTGSRALQVAESVADSRVRAVANRAASRQEAALATQAAVQQTPARVGEAVRNTGELVGQTLDKREQKRDQK